MAVAATEGEAGDPRNRPYRPYGSAAAAWRDRSPELLLSGPAGTGKSRALLEKLHFCAEKYPGMRGLLLRKTRESLTESALVTFERIVLPEGHPVLDQGGQRRFRHVYVYPNGSEMIVGGLDRPSKVMSTEFDLAYIQEAVEVSEQDWETVTTRLRHGKMPYQSLLADTNPERPSHWLKQRCDTGGTRMLESRHEDNPLLWDPSARQWTEAGRRYIATLDRLTGARKERLRYGRWAAAEGLVYEDWDASVHLIDRMPAGWESWTKVRAIDFGYTNPFVCLWFAVDPDGRLYLYRELYHTRRRVQEHAAKITRHSGGERYGATVADHDAEDRATLHAAGIATTPARKAISPGIQAVQGRLQPAGDGRPRLFLLRSALVERDEALGEAKKPWSTAQEFDGYVWPKGSDGRPLKEVPVDEDNHGMDALRYGVMQLDGRRELTAY